MKRYTWLLIVIGLVICTVVWVTTACDTDTEPPRTDMIVSETKEITENKEYPVEFTAEYVRTGSYIEENYYPIVQTVDSYTALKEYCENNKDNYYLDGFDAYTEKLFEEKSLIFVILEEGSGSIRHTVEYVMVNDGIMDIGIEPIIPEAGTDDIAIWHIIIAVDKDAIPESEEDIRIFYNGKEMVREHFDFFIRWNTYGISSYDSRTGLLVKTDDATHPEDYITCLYLSVEQMKNIRNIIEELDITSYPDEYNPHGEGVSTPYMTLELTVTTEGYTKTVSVPETVLSFETEDTEGQRFLDAFGAIVDMITHTDEWLGLPDYEFYYD